MDTRSLANQLGLYLADLPEVKSWGLYGSLQAGTNDRFSDIDIALDVSGYDNGDFLLRLPGLVAGAFPVFYSDFAPSLAPEQYLVTLALDQNNPFVLADITCQAAPHIKNVSAQTLRRRNQPYEHALKLFTANLKHFLRGADCRADILKMAAALAPQQADEALTEHALLCQCFAWLKGRAKKEHERYLSVFEALL